MSRKKLRTVYGKPDTQPSRKTIKNGIRHFWRPNPEKHFAVSEHRLLIELLLLTNNVEDSRQSLRREAACLDIPVLSAALSPLHKAGVKRYYPK